MTSEQQQTIAATPEGWTALVPFQQFDPSLGTLTGVQVLLNGTLTGSISLENLGSAAATVTVAVPGTIDVSANGVDLGSLDFASGPIATVTLGAFDGVKDFAGSSGTVISKEFSAGNLTTGFDDTSDLARFTGTGTVDLSLTSDGSSQVIGDADLRDLLNINSGGVVTLQYQYTAPGEAAAATSSGDFALIDSIALSGGDSTYVGTSQTTAAQIVALTDQISGWSSIVTVNKFDPSLGTPREVLVTIQNDLTGTVAVDNLSAQAWDVGFDQSAAVSVAVPGNGTLEPATVTDDSSASLDLGAYDGTTDFTGTSGTIVSFSNADPLAVTATGGGTLTDDADLLAFTGAGTIALSVNSTGLSDMIGPPNLLSEIAQSTGATVSVSYVYSTASGAGDYESTSSPTVAGGLAAPDGGTPAGPVPTFVTAPAFAFPACFAAGTRIATPNGPIAIEQLRERDIVLTVSGGRECVNWIGHRRVDCLRHPSPDRIMPVRIAAHAFGLGRPEQPVLLSPDHAVFVEDVLIPVKFLINGDTVAQIEVDSITYCHLELPRHDVVLAEGLPVESYLETGGRAEFENADGPIALYPDFMTLWRERGYAPLLGETGQLARARLKVLLQAQLLAGEESGSSNEHDTDDGLERLPIRMNR